MRLTTKGFNLFTAECSVPDEKGSFHLDCKKVSNYQFSFDDFADGLFLSRAEVAQLVEMLTYMERTDPVAFRRFNKESLHGESRFKSQPLCA